MKKAFGQIGVLATAVFFALPAMSDEAFNRSTIGGLKGTTQGEREGAFVIEGTKHHDQKQLLVLSSKPFVYGTEHGRLELGSGIGLTGAGFAGAGYLTPASNGSSGVFVGLEPVNLQVTLNSNDEREDFIEWSPMASVGLHLDTDVCRATALARGGLSLGSLGDGGLRVAKGMGAYLACEHGQLAGEMTRIKTDTGDVDLATIDLSVIAIPRFAIGMRGESIVTRKDKVDFIDAASGGTANDRSERRVLLTAGGAF